MNFKQLLANNEFRVLCMPPWVRNLQRGTAMVSVKTASMESLEKALLYHKDAASEIRLEMYNRHSTEIRHLDNNASL